LYLCIAIDFKNHGCSTRDNAAYDILAEPWIVREDFDATLDYLETLNLNHSDEVIVFGASIGACVATYVSSYEQVIGGIAASANKYYTELMSENSFTPEGMYYFAGELDVTSTSEYEEDAYSLLQLTESPTDVYIKDGTNAHGVDLFINNPQLEAEATVLYS
jgi:pimeloyl-ACP methyl ester carboxylesterase